MIYDSEKRLYILMALIAGLAVLSLALSIMALYQAGVNQGFIQALGGVK